ncbi:hypothetical protein BDW71DRAFT_175085 [Aspergillus fruticulosus]
MMLPSRFFPGFPGPDPVPRRSGERLGPEYLARRRPVRPDRTHNVVACYSTKAEYLHTVGFEAHYWNDTRYLTELQTPQKVGESDIYRKWPLFHPQPYGWQQPTTRAHASATRTVTLNIRGMNFRCLVWAGLEPVPCIASPIDIRAHASFYSVPVSL